MLALDSNVLSTVLRGEETAESIVRMLEGRRGSVVLHVAAFTEYAERRRRSGGGQPRRILADFLIGAHAAVTAGELLTLDPQHYRQRFSELRVLNPLQ